MHAHHAAVQVQNALDDGQAQPGTRRRAALLGVGGAPVALEDVGQVPGLDAPARVAHADLHERAPVLDDQRDRAALRGVAQRVVDEVLQHPLDHRDVGAHLGLHVAARRQAERHPTLLGREPVVLHHVLQQLGQAEHLVPGLPSAGVELRQLEQIGNALAQHFDMPQRGAQVRGARRRVERLAAHEHRLDVTLNARQGRAQVMRNVADQLASLPVAIFEPPKLLRDALLHRLHGAVQHADLVAGFTMGVRIAIVAERLQLVGEPAQRSGQLPPGDPQHGARQQRRQRRTDGHRAQRVRVRQAGRDTLRLAAVEHDVQVAHGAAGLRHRSHRKRVRAIGVTRVGAQHRQEHGGIVRGAQQAAHRRQIDLCAHRVRPLQALQRMGQDASVCVQQIHLHRRVDRHHVQGQLLHAAPVSLAVGADQARRLVLGDIARQPQVHALAGLERGLCAVVLQKVVHRRTQTQQQGHGHERRAHVQAPPHRPARLHACRIHAATSKR